MYDFFFETKGGTEMGDYHCNHLCVITFNTDPESYRLH